MSFLSPDVYPFTTTIISSEYGSQGMSWLRGQCLLEARDAAWEPGMQRVELDEPVADPVTTKVPQSAGA